jgi:hypothetical protein
MDKKLLIIGLVVLLVIVIGVLLISPFALAFLFYLGILNPNMPAGGPAQCTFGPGITCVTYKLHAGTSELDLNIGQGTGQTMNITGLACTKNTSQYYTKENSINNYASNPITIPSGSMHFISQSGTSQVVRCTDANGNLPSDTSAGTPYSGRLYINYTDEIGMTRIATGVFSTTYKA